MSHFITAENAIVDSKRHNRITFQDFDKGIMGQLEAMADDYVVNGDVTEYWGTDDDGSEWRVHVANS